MTVCPVEIDSNEARINRKIKYKQKPATRSELTSLLELKGFLQLRTGRHRVMGTNDPLTHIGPCVSEEKFSLNVESNFCEFYLNLPIRHFFFFKIRKFEID